MGDMFASEPSVSPVLQMSPRRQRRWLPVGLLIALVFLAAVTAYAWFYLLNPCNVDEVAIAADFLVIQLKQYDDVYMSAVSGTPNSLTYPITVMQQILVDTQQVAIPACMRTTRTELLTYMGAAIQALQAFTAGAEDQTIRALVYQSNTHYDNFYAELDAVKECAPYCFR